MATSNVGGMTILPQYQGDYYSLQNKQALAQALMQGSMQNQASLIPTNMPVMPKYSVGAGLAQLGQALIAGKMQNDVAHGYQSLGQQQMASLLGAPRTDVSSTGNGNTLQSGDMSGQWGAVNNDSPQAFPVAPPTSTSSSLQGGLLSRGGPLNPNGMDPGAAAMMYMSGPEGQKELFKGVNAAYAPTAATLAARQGNFDPIQANQAAFRKDISIPVAPNSSLVNAGTGAFTTAPAAAPAGYQTVQLANGSFAQVPVAGGLGAVAGSAAAELAGKNSQTPYNGFDAKGNPLPTSTVGNVINNAGATTPNQQAIVQTESGGNPNAVSPKGALGAWQVMPNTATNPGYGVTPARDNSSAELNRVGKDYYETMSNRYGNPTLGAIAYNMGPDATDKWLAQGGSFNKLPSETQQYIGKVATQTALNSRGQVATASPVAPSATYGAQPLGAQKNAEGLASGQIETMQKSYQNLQGMRANGPAALQDLATMSKVAPGASFTTVGPYGSDLAALFSNDAKTYAKSRDHLIATMGAQLGMNTDAGRAFVAGAIPEYGAPSGALQKGLSNIQGQIQANMLKSDFLSSQYASGNAKAYNLAENQFDQNITPALANIIAMPAGPGRAAALTAAIKDPQLRSRLDWAANQGILK